MAFASARSGGVRTTKRLLPVAGAVLALAIAGCGSSGSDSSAGSSGKVTLTLLACCDQSLMGKAVDRWNQGHPDVQVKQQVVPFDNLNDVVQTRVGQRDPSIDLYYADQPRTAALASRNLLKDITDDYLPAAQGVLSEAAIKESTYRNRLFSAPFWTSSEVLFYNKDQLAKAGVAAPSADPAHRITREQVAADAKKVEQANGLRCGYIFEQLDRYFQLQPLLESPVGGGSGLTGPDNLTPDLRNPGVVRGVTYYRDLAAGGVLPRGNISQGETAQMFQSGKCPYLEAGPAVGVPFPKQAGLHFGVAAIPQFAGGRAVTPTGSFAFGVNPATKHVKQVMDFIKFATLDDQGALAAGTGIGAPVANVKVLAQQLNDQFGGDPSLAPIVKLVPAEIAGSAVSRPQSKGYIDFETIMNTTFADLRSGAPVDASLDKAQTQLKAAFSQIS